MLADEIDFVIGVDTHRDSHALALVDAAGRLHHTWAIDTCGAGYIKAHEDAESRAPGRRIWAIEGTGSYGAGLCRHLMAAGERVVEVERPERPRRRGGAKSDALDAVRAAREVLLLSCENHAIPRQGDIREALRVLLTTRELVVTGKTAAINQIKGFLVSAPDELRAELRTLSAGAQLRRLVALRSHPSHSVARRALVGCLRSVARRARELDTEIRALEAQIGALIKAHAPRLLTEFGVGPIVAAQLLVAFSHVGRFRSDAAFASLAGTAPLPASSGQVQRHRLNRGGDRQLNRAIRTVVLTRMGHCAKTRAYIARRTNEGKSKREAMRALMRHVARGLFRLLTEIMSEAGLQRVAPSTPPVATTKPRHEQMRSAADILARLTLEPPVEEAPLAT
jgi:transposase